MTDLQILETILQEKESLLIEVSDKIWHLAELPYAENRSSALLCEVLERAGFAIHKGVAGIPTAFVARFVSGSGKPVMGVLAEYDALDMLSQAAGSPIKCPVSSGAPGHGCGHNALGAGSLGAALLLAQYLQQTGKSGTVVFYGCAAEEGAGAKQFMARAGLFDDADFIYTWHPATRNGVDGSFYSAIMGANFAFTGVSAHAGGSPHLGRSALDAAELMNIGCNFLREHMIDQARVHYAFSDAGGTAPNVVQDHAVVKYEVRSPKVCDVKALFERVVNVAKGAALMTDTQVDVEVTMAFSDYVPNAALAAVADECMQEIGAPNWDDADYALAKAFLSTYNETTRDYIRSQMAEMYGEDRVSALWEKPLDATITPYDPVKKVMIGGSTDVGDVTYAAPTLNLLVATACIGTVGHTWQMTGQAGSRIAHKGLITAAKAMALSAVRTMERPDVIQRAKEFLQKQNGGRYVCPLPDDVLPPIGRY